MSQSPLELRPRLRSVQVVPMLHKSVRLFVLLDPEGLTEEPLVLSEAELSLAGELNGRLTVAEIAADLSRRLAGEVPETELAERLAELVGRLEEAGLLDGPVLRSRLRRADREWAELPARPALRLLEADTESANRAVLAGLLARHRSGAETAPTAPAGRLLGLVAPHLDYARGGPCYAASYGLLGERSKAKRFVVLGTNHFGHAWDRLVAADKDFRTPLGLADCDRAFLSRLSESCGWDFTEGAADHGREHSVELQVRWLQYLLGDGEWSFVPFLVPDPCGPTGTAPRSGRGVDLDEFADKLTAAIRADAVSTCVIAGADLAHVGQEFGDDDRLNELWLSRVRQQDETLIDRLADADPAGMVAHLRRDDNARRVCSAGCLYVLSRVMAELGGAPTRLGYHQAVNHQTQTAVTCTAMAYVAREG